MDTDGTAPPGAAAPTGQAGTEPTGSVSDQPPVHWRQRPPTNKQFQYAFALACSISCEVDWLSVTTRGELSALIDSLKARRDAAAGTGRLTGAPVTNRQVDWLRRLMMAAGEKPSHRRMKTMTGDQLSAEIERLKQKLRAARPGPRPGHSKREAIGMLEGELREMREKGYTLAEVAEHLALLGLDISPGTLAAYLRNPHRTRTSDACRHGRP